MVEITCMKSLLRKVFIQDETQLFLINEFVL
jgi:hypothetical protein